MDFVVAQMACLRPGGVAVHTTEYLVSSNDATVEAGGTVFYRRRDIEGLVQRLRRAGHDVDMDYSLGSTPEDEHVDVAALHRRAPAHGAGRLRHHVAGADRDEGRLGGRGPGAGAHTEVGSEWGRLSRNGAPMTPSR